MTLSGLTIVAEPAAMCHHVASIGMFHQDSPMQNSEVDNYVTKIVSISLNKSYLNSVYAQYVCDKRLIKCVKDSFHFV